MCLIPLEEFVWFLLYNLRKRAILYHKNSIFCHKLMEGLFNKYSLKVFLRSDETIIYEASICAQLLVNLLCHHCQGWFWLNITFEIRIVGKKGWTSWVHFQLFYFAMRTRMCLLKFSLVVSIWYWTIPKAVEKSGLCQLS